MKYLIIILIIIFFFLLGQNNKVVNTNYNKVKFIFAEKFSNDNPLKIYTDNDFNEIRNKYHNWLIQNKKGKKSFIIPTSNTEYFNSFTSKITSFREITNPIIKSDFFNEVNKYNLDLGDNNLSGFLAYTEPSIKFKITFEIDEIIPEDLYIEYIVKNKNGDSYSNFTYYQHKVKEHNYIKKGDVENKLMKNKPIIFERPTNLDGQDNIYGNLQDNKKFEINRELYLYDGSYNIEFKFYSSNVGILNKIVENVKITLFNERLKLNETISPTNLDKSNSDEQPPINIIEYYQNYYGKKFLEYKVEEVKERLRLTVYPEDVKIIDDNLIISNDSDNYNYYKLVILGLLVLHEIYRKINDETKEIKDLNMKLEIYRDLLIPVLIMLPGELTEEQKKNLEEIKAKLFKSETKKTDRATNMDNLIAEYQKNNDLNLGLGDNLKQIDESYEDIIKKLLEKIDSKLKEEIYSSSLNYRSVKLGGLEESTNILNLKPKPKEYFSYTFNNYKDPISRENIYSLLGNVSPRQYVVDTVKSIQSNFKNIFGKNRANLKDVNFLSLMDKNLKNRLSTISKYSNEYEKENAKTKGEIISKDFEQYKIFNEIKNIITHFIEQINTNSTLYANLDDEGKLNTLRELVSPAISDMSEYKYGDLIIIDSDPTNKPFAPMETFSNINDLNAKFNEKMGEVRNKINKFKKKSHNSIEMFSNIENFTNMDTHKHTETGKINFTGPLDIDNSEWYENQENKKIIQDYSFLDNDNKEDLINSLGEVEKSILDSNTKIQSLVDSYAEFRPNIMSNNVKASIELAENDLNKANNEIDLQKYKNKEAEQEHRLKDVNNKVAELEKIQNKIYDSNKDDYKSIQSFSDGQILSINNKGNQEYSININGQCLGYDEEGISNSKCINDKNQLFNVFDIKNDTEYNKLLANNKKPLVTEFSNVKYPFQVVNPLGQQAECLTLNGNSVGLSQCDNSKFQRWEALKSTNDCGNI